MYSVLYVCMYVCMYVFEIPAVLKMAATYTRLFSATISFRTESKATVFGIASAIELILEENVCMYIYFNVCMYVCMYVFMYVCM